MIAYDISLRKLVKLALLSSLLLVGVTLVPWFFTLKTVAKEFYLHVFVVFYLNMLIIWAVNIFFLTLFEKNPRYQYRNKLRYLLCIVLGVLLSGSFQNLVDFFNMADIYLKDEEVYELILLRNRSFLVPYLSSFMPVVFVLFMQEFVLMREKKAKIELDYAQLKIANSRAINQQLKQHIHPHFLFNSLSILKSLIHKDTEVAEAYVIRLSDFLRTSITSNESNLVRVKDELKLCDDFIQLQKIRFGDALHVQIEISETIAKNGYVPGFSLQLLLENAIKHNAFTIHMPLVIKVLNIENRIEAHNNIQKKQSIESSTQSGLANLSKRYQIISGHDIVIDQKDATFGVSVWVLNKDGSLFKA